MPQRSAACSCVRRAEGAVRMAGTRDEGEGRRRSVRSSCAAGIHACWEEGYRQYENCRRKHAACVTSAGT